MMRIEDMTRAHVPSVAKLHADALSGDFLPNLGGPFLRALYEGILDLRLGQGYVTTDQDRVCGFVLGTFDSGSLFRRLLAARGLRLGAAALGPVVRQPRLLRNFFETLLYPGKEGQAQIAAELMVIAVADGYRSAGIGGQLVQRLDDAFRSHGVSRYKVTVHKQREDANRFYQRLGFVHQYAFTLYGKEWNLYARSLADNPASEGAPE